MHIQRKMSGRLGEAQGINWYDHDTVLYYRHLGSIDWREVFRAELEHCGKEERLLSRIGDLLFGFIKYRGKF